MTTTDPMPAPIDHDFPCATCNYNLRTRLPSDLCPECATPIADSIKRRTQFSHILYHPARAIVASHMLIVGTLLEILSVLCSYIPLSYLTAPAFRIAFELGELFGISLSSVGLILFIFSIRKTFFTPPGAPWRILAFALRIALNLSFAGTISVDLYTSWNIRVHHIFLSPSYYVIYNSIMALNEFIDLALGIIVFAYFIRLVAALRSIFLFAGTIICFILTVLGQFFYFLLHIIYITYYVSPRNAMSTRAIIGFRSGLGIAGIAIDCGIVVLLFVLIHKLRPHVIKPTPGS